MSPARREPEEIADGCIALRARPRSHRSRPVLPEPLRRAGFHARRGNPDPRRAARSMPTLRQGRRLLCLPGTHTKWVVLEDGVIERISHGADRRTVRAAARSQRAGARRDAPRRVDGAAFAGGLGALQRISRRRRCCTGCSNAAAACSAANCRRASAAAFLSGLLIASDVAGALQSVCAIAIADTHRAPDRRAAADALYAAALAGRCACARQLDGAAAVARRPHARAPIISHRRWPPMPSESARLTMRWSRSCAASSRSGSSAWPRCCSRGHSHHRSAAQLARSVREHRRAGRRRCGPIAWSARAPYSNVEDVRRTHAAGGRLIVAPNCDAEVIGEACGSACRSCRASRPPRKPSAPFTPAPRN